MTRYSWFQYSQPDDCPAKVPDIDDFEADVKALSTWVDEFGKRAVAGAPLTS